jgi:hypothetical protein
LRNFVRVGTGLIYAAIVAAWAAYLVPLWIRRYEEAADASPVAGFVPRARVLVRRRHRVGGGSTPVDASRSAEASRPAGERYAGSAPGRSSAGPSPASPSPMRRSTAGRSNARQTAARSKAARAAAARRRRILVALVTLTVIVGVLGALALAPWWSLVVPTTAVAVFLTISARVARVDRVRERGRPESASASGPGLASGATRSATKVAGPVSDAAVARDARVGTAGGASVRAHDAARQTEEHRDDRIRASAHHADGPQVGGRPGPLGVERTDEASAAESKDRSGYPVDTSSDSGAAEAGWWDPIQVPLPTYIGKAKATRTVRTVDLGEPGAWTSGRLPEAELLARPDESAMLLDETEPEAATPHTESGSEAPPGDQRKAVGD